MPYKQLRMLGWPACLDVLLEVALEAAVQDLALAGLQAVHHARDGALQVHAREQDQLLRRMRWPSVLEVGLHARLERFFCIQEQHQLPAPRR